MFSWRAKYSCRAFVGFCKGQLSSFDQVHTLWALSTHSLTWLTLGDILSLWWCWSDLPPNLQSPLFCHLEHVKLTHTHTHTHTPSSFSHSMNYSPKNKSREKCHFLVTNRTPPGCQLPYIFSWFLSPGSSELLWQLLDPPNLFKELWSSFQTSAFYWVLL
jgi:hypothetical protein